MPLPGNRQSFAVYLRRLTRRYHEAHRFGPIALCFVTRAVLSTQALGPERELVRLGVPKKVTS
jgi:hypothetical protein